MSRNITEKAVVSCFLESGSKILLLRRSQRVGSYQGKWAGVSGYVETTPDEQALVEIGEETGLSREDFSLVKRGEPLSVEDERLRVRWLIHPYLFRVKDRTKGKIDWEHDELRGIDPEDIDDYSTVPSLKEALARVYPS